MVLHFAMQLCALLVFAFFFFTFIAQFTRCLAPGSYNILAPNVSAGISDANEASKRVIGSLDLDQDEYRFGSTKVLQP